MNYDFELEQNRVFSTGALSGGGNSEMTQIWSPLPILQKDHDWLILLWQKESVWNESLEARWLANRDKAEKGRET